MEILIFKDFVSLLPYELRFKILSYLKPKDLLNAERVSKFWHEICNDEYLWLELCKEERICTRVQNNKKKQNGSSLDLKNLTSSSCWKLCYIRQKRLENIWKTRQTNNYSKLINYNAEMVSCIQISEKYFACSSFDAFINIFSMNTGQSLSKLIGHLSGVIVFKLLGNILISGDGDGVLKIWNIETGECNFTLFGHTNRISCLCVHENIFVSGSSDFSLTIWNFNTGKCLKTLKGHTAAVRCIDFNGDYIISGSSDRTVKIWNLIKGECLRTLEGHKYDIIAVKFNGAVIVSSSMGSICVWDFETGNLKNNLMGCKDCFAFTEKSDIKFNKNMFAFINVLYSPNPYVHFKCDIKICDFGTGEYLQTLSDQNEDSSHVKYMQFVLNFVLTSTFGSTIKLWDMKTGKFIRNLININLQEGGYYVHGFRANETKLVCLTQCNTFKNRLLILDFDFQQKNVNKIMRQTLTNRNCNII